MRRSSNAPSHVRPNEKEIEIEKRDRYSVDTSERVEDRERERAHKSRWRARWKEPSTRAASSP